MIQLVNIPLETFKCYEVVATVPAKCDYKFLSANATFALTVNEGNCLMMPTLYPYYFPAHKDTFINDLRRGGTVVEVIGTDFFIRGSSAPPLSSNSSFSSYFSAVSCSPAVPQIQFIKGYVGAAGNEIFINKTTGCVYDLPRADWATVNCDQSPSVGHL